MTDLYKFNMDKRSYNSYKIGSWSTDVLFHPMVAVMWTCNSAINFAKVEDTWWSYDSLPVKETYETMHH